MPSLLRFISPFRTLGLRVFIGNMGLGLRVFIGSMGLGFRVL